MSEAEYLWRGLKTQSQGEKLINSLKCVWDHGKSSERIPSFDSLNQI